VLLEGEVEFTLRGRCYLLTRPAYICLPPGEPVNAVSTADLHPLNLSLHIRRESISKAWLHHLVPQSWGVPVREAEWFDVTARACVQLGRHRAEQNLLLSEALAQALFLHFLRDATLPPESSTQREMRRLANAIRLDPSHDWSVEDLARETGMSRSQFHRTFREVIGESPRAFLTYCRLERAKRLLSESAMNITEIAAATGYADVYFFSRHFKRHTGMAPSAFREQDQMSRRA